ncbi:hypothetical protein T492DRAFT_989688, partial [Pavlovales sp. CCMP2436]
MSDSPAALQGGPDSKSLAQPRPAFGGWSNRPSAVGNRLGSGGGSGGLRVLNQLHDKALGARPAGSQTLFQLTQLEFKPLGSSAYNLYEGAPSEREPTGAVVAAEAYIHEDYPRAVKEWTRALSGEQSITRTCYVLRHRAAAYVRLGQLDEARHDLERCLGYQPGSFDALALLAEVLFPFL